MWDDRIALQVYVLDRDDNVLATQNIDTGQTAVLDVPPASLSCAVVVAAGVQADFDNAYVDAGKHWIQISSHLVNPKWEWWFNQLKIVREQLLTVALSLLGIVLAIIGLKKATRTDAVTVSVSRYRVLSGRRQCQCRLTFYYSGRTALVPDVDTPALRLNFPGRILSIASKASNGDGWIEPDTPTAEQTTFEVIYKRLISGDELRVDLVFETEEAGATPSLAIESPIANGSRRVEVHLRIDYHSCPN